LGGPAAVDARLARHSRLGAWHRGLYLAVGFCGHGFQHSPAAGEMVAELLTTGRTSLDISDLRLDRFGRAA
jgi:glycine/D-amino acid oxidase-like deaminating enzyme